MTDSIHPLHRERLEALLQLITEVRLLVVGDIMLDRYLMGEVERISPEAPVPIVNVSDEWSVPGGAANVAANIMAMGAEVRLVGTIGDDLAGENLLELVAAFGIPTDGLITVQGRPTTTKTRLLARGQQVVRIDRELVTGLPEAANQLVLSRAAEALESCDALILEDYDKGLLSPEIIQQVMALAKRAGVPVAVDPKYKNFHHYTGATLFKPNRRELEAALAHTDPTEPLDLEAARQELNVDNLLVTLGAEGMVLASSGDRPRRAPSIARDVFDVSGAGDTVIAWSAATLAAGGTAAEAAWLANLAASVEVGKRGTATVSPDEILEAWEQEER